MWLFVLTSIIIALTTKKVNVKIEKERQYPKTKAGLQGRVLPHVTPRSLIILKT
jgi:hypothetical protein